MSEEAESSTEEERGGLLLVKQRHITWARWVRDGNLDIILPLAVLAVLSVAVLVYNSFFREWEPCDENKPLAKRKRFPCASYDYGRSAACTLSASAQLCD